MKKEFIGDFEFNTIEIDIKNNIYKIDGVDVGKGTQNISISISATRVITTIQKLVKEKGYAERKATPTVDDVALHLKPISKKKE